MHIVKAKSIGLLLSDQVSPAARVFIIPSRRVEITTVRPRRSRAAGIFPFGLARYSITFASLLRQLLAEFFRLIPQYTLNWQIIANEIRRVVTTHHGLPLSLCDLVFADGESLHGDAMLWPFLRITSIFTFWRTHPKLSTAHTNHLQLHAVQIFSKRFSGACGAANGETRQR